MGGVGGFAGMNREISMQKEIRRMLENPGGLLDRERELESFVVTMKNNSLVRQDELLEFLRGVPKMDSERVLTAPRRAKLLRILNKVYGTNVSKLEMIDEIITNTDGVLNDEAKLESLMAVLRSTGMIKVDGLDEFWSNLQEASARSGNSLTAEQRERLRTVLNRVYGSSLSSVATLMESIHLRLSRLEGRLEGD